MKEEIFDPVLAMKKTKNFNKSIEMANDTEYGWTDAINSINRLRVEQANMIFHVK